MKDNKEKEDKWRIFIQRGLEVQQETDSVNWKLGDLAIEVETAYGEDSIGKYAREIRVERKTLMNYRTVSRAFSQTVRNEYPKLTFSHFSVVTSIEKREHWLEQTSINGWSVERLRTQVKKAYKGLTPPKLSDKAPEVYKCPSCGLWRLRGLSSFEICKGHYEIREGKTIYE